MFVGEFAHKLDSKNRLIMPAKFRNELGQSCMVTKGLDGCLSVYTNKDWDVVMEKLMTLPTTKKEARLYVRSLTSKATECEFDSQGRIQLPASLISEGQLEKDVVVVGVGNKVELWSKQRWDTYNQEADTSFEEVAESITDFLL